MSPLLQAVGISKSFGDLRANDAIDLDLRPAEIHALLGENGAGKSTLVKIIYGLIQPSAGELRFMGRPVVFDGPAQARALGIGMVFQHFSCLKISRSPKTSCSGCRRRNPSLPSLRGSPISRAPTACRSNRGARCGACRWASGSASRSCAR